MLADVTEASLKPRLIASNKRARYEYHILEELECGIALTGTEVKSLRQGRCTLGEGYGMIRAGELHLVNVHIPEYAQGNVHNHAPTRERKLLLHRREIDSWESKVRQKGVTIVPLSMYFKGSRVKLAIALCKGKKQYDKRQHERTKSDQREIDRAMSRRH